jgi:hypothetical protein
MSRIGTLLLHKGEARWNWSWISRCPTCEGAHSEDRGTAAQDGDELQRGDISSDEENYLASDSSSDEAFYLSKEESDLLDREENYESKTKRRTGCKGNKTKQELHIVKGRGNKKGLVSRRELLKFEKGKAIAADAAEAKQARRQIRIDAHIRSFSLEMRRPNEYKISWSSTAIWQNHHVGTRETEDHAASELGLDLATYRLLLEMQERDITPEDYEFLVHVHSVANKPETLSIDSLELIPVLRVSKCLSVKLPPGVLLVDSDAACLICLGDFEEGEEIRQLPCSCKHVFHKNCIDTWLSEHGSFCPIDKTHIDSKFP